MGAVLLAAFAVLCIELSSKGNTLMSTMSMTFAVPLALFQGGKTGIGLGQRVSRALQGETNDRKRRLLQLQALAGVLLVFPGAIAGMCWGISVQSAIPNDAVLLANFNNKEAVFNELVSMLNADKKLMIVDNTWTKPSNPNTVGVSSPRIDKYRELLHSANIPRGLWVNDNREIRFHYHIRGSAMSNEQIKGYAFLTKPPKDLRKQLNDCDKEFLVYRHIQGNWYLFYQYMRG